MESRQNKTKQQQQQQLRLLDMQRKVRTMLMMTYKLTMVQAQVGTKQLKMMSLVKWVEQQNTNESTAAKPRDYIVPHDPAPLRRLTRVRKPTISDNFVYLTETYIKLLEFDVPITSIKVVSSSNVDKWMEAMQSELISKENIEVWELMEHTKGIKPIGFKLVFKTKRVLNGNYGSKRRQTLVRQLFGAQVGRLGGLGGFYNFY